MDGKRYTLIFWKTSVYLFKTVRIFFERYTLIFLWGCVYFSNSKGVTRILCALFVVEGLVRAALSLEFSSKIPILSLWNTSDIPSTSYLSRYSCSLRSGGARFLVCIGSMPARWTRTVPPHNTTPPLAIMPLVSHKIIQKRWVDLLMPIPRSASVGTISSQKSVRKNSYFLSSQ